MQDEKTVQQLTREYESNMPPEIMKMIQSFDWKKEVRTIVNQNQLMIDTGADLEESIYLMILGVIQVEDLYERLMDVHEIPEDKTKKIIGEMEQHIFNPLYKKMMELEPDELSAEPVSESEHRDTILAEIEKEPEPLIKLNLNSIQNTQTVADSSSNVSNQMVSNSPQADGIVKPFSIPSKDPVVPPPPPPPPPPIESKKIVEGAIDNPIKATLQNPTITINPEQKPKGYTPDPYREPIE